MIKNITVSILLCIFVIPCIASATFKLPDTGQTKCYQAVDPYAKIPCDNTGQDGAYNINPMSYTDNGNGTVTDNNTGLMWQQRSSVNEFNWYQASGTYHSTDNRNSHSVCGSLDLGGHTDWRLPTKKELISIVYYGIMGLDLEPKIKSEFFPRTPASGYWSSTARTDGVSGAWYVDFVYGIFSTNSKSHSYYVRCVRGGQ